MTGKGRKAILSCISRIVIKVGSNVLASSEMALDDSIVKGVSEGISGAMDRGHRIVLVSSGAILAGIPCVDGIDLTQLRSGDVVEVDADEGTVTRA